MADHRVLKLYRGFGHTHDLVLFGHVLKNQLKTNQPGQTGALRNLCHLVDLFVVRPMGSVAVQATWNGKKYATRTEDDGFFWMEWKSTEHTAAGTYNVTVQLQDQPVEASTELVVPHLTQYAFVSDLDDTVMVSHSAASFKRMKELFFKSPSQRSVFEGVSEYYQQLALSHTTPDQPNPFFYVSSSEWNLYDYLEAFLQINQLPPGALLLSQLKKWYQLFKTGKTKHEGKLLRIMRLFVLFPKQRFVLLGDNSQSDPAIYETLTQKYADRIAAVYIRNVMPEKAASTAVLLQQMAARSIAVLQFAHTGEAVAHSAAIGLIDPNIHAGFSDPS